MFMANRRRLQVLSRHASALFSTNTTFQSLQTPPALPIYQPLKTLTSKFPLIFTNPDPNWSQTRHFSSSRVGDVNEDNEHSEEEEDDDDDDDYDDDDEAVGDSEDESVSGCGSKREYTAEEKEAEAAAIGYQVIGPLQKSDRVFKPYEPVFAVVQIGSHQFKVSNGDCIFTERLKFCEVNDKLILNKVLLLGSSSQTIIGRPLLPDAAVHAVVEEHALDAKVIIFKKKRRKNYRRTKGHRQELTKLRIVDVQGIEKPDVPEKPPKAPGKKPEKVAVAA
ncbi:PREDICTED: 50S ribosomal protein L21, mitochondrial [Prunus mume]|uniref:Large ribosomal subunit protein bL21m n=1 Tax=Prunus mume TaxID=102107 RepID=A0ABM0NI15_PRUMU|nr:PREDICTED: 50S ribosomal protein L21, mitochondrial [Prunus mume]